MNASDVCPPGADDRFGPNVVGYRDNFDFTLLFEQSILSLGPSALVIVASVARIFQLYRSSIKTASTSLRIGKSVQLVAEQVPISDSLDLADKEIQATMLGAFCIRLALLVLWITKPSRQSRESTAAAALSLIAALALSVLSHVEYSRSVRPSFIINVYLFFSTLLDLAQTRTL